MNNFTKRDKKIFGWCIFSCSFIVGPVIYIILHACGAA